MPLIKRSVCTIATEVSTRAGNAIVVINFRMMGLGLPHDHGNGKLDHKVRRASRFVQMLWRRSAWRLPVAPRSLRGLQRQRYLPLQRARAVQWCAPAWQTQCSSRIGLDSESATGFSRVQVVDPLAASSKSLSAPT